MQTNPHTKKQQPPYTHKFPNKLSFNHNHEYLAVIDPFKSPLWDSFHLYKKKLNSNQNNRTKEYLEILNKNNNPL